jgi:hypothetical protein
VRLPRAAGPCDAPRRAPALAAAHRILKAACSRNDGRCRETQRGRCADFAGLPRVRSWRIATVSPNGIPHGIASRLARPTPALAGERAPTGPSAHSLRVGAA